MYALVSGLCHEQLIHLLRPPIKVRRQTLYDDTSAVGELRGSFGTRRIVYDRLLRAPRRVYMHAGCAAGSICCGLEIVLSAKLQPPFTQIAHVKAPPPGESAD